MIHVLIIGIGDTKKAEQSAIYQMTKKIVYVSRDRVEDRIYAAKNIWTALNGGLVQAADDDVICLLDGDDELNGCYALEPIRAAYQSPNVWLTYGSYERMSGDPRTFNGPYRSDDRVRTFRWHASHLKTFRYGLWKHLPESALKDPDGEWLKVCSDVAIMIPLIEMAGMLRTRYIKQTIYQYNDLNPENDHKTRAEEQLRIAKWLRTQKPFERLEKL
jgi:glycosyltransferase involved in cell wall biosynthesis